MSRKTFDLDADLILKDAGVVGASAVANYGGAPRSIYIGNARFDGAVILDIDAIEINSNDERYNIILEGSTDPAFGAGSVDHLAVQNLGATGGRLVNAKDSVVGRREMYFTNYQNDITYPYIRLFTEVGGTVATGINYRAYAAKLPGM